MEIQHSHYKDKDFAIFLRKMKELKCFHLSVGQCVHLSDTFLLELPFETIEEIFLINPIDTHFDQSLLCVMIKKSKKLQTYVQELRESGIVGVLEGLPSQANSLKNLTLSSLSSLGSQSSLLSTLSALKHLEKLDFCGCLFVNDAVLEVVGKNCKKLTNLEVSDHDGITDCGISSICKLEKLTYLNTSSSETIRNPPLEKLTSLVVLDTAWNSLIEEKCLCSFLEKAHKLRALDVSWCSLVTNKLLNCAIEIAQTRNINNALNLYVKKTEINMNVVDENPPFLNISSSRSMGAEYVKYGIEDPYFGMNHAEVYAY